MMIENDKEKSLNDATPPEVQNDIRSETTGKIKGNGSFKVLIYRDDRLLQCNRTSAQEKEINPKNIDLSFKVHWLKRCWRLVCKVTGDVRGVPEVC
jgi:hypothetical protein